MLVPVIVREFSVENALNFPLRFPHAVNCSYICNPFRDTMHLTAERKKELFAKFGGTDTNTGSTEAQIAMFTERINHISAHLKGQRKDKSAELSLIKLVGKRRSLLNYLAKQDIFKYRNLIKELGLRK
jgi:small subunit ribosomal protein S15